MRVLLFITFLTITYSCVFNDKHELLIKVTGKYIGPDGAKMDGYFKDHENFMKDYFKVSQIGDTLSVSYLFDDNSCSEKSQNISISNDTLYLSSNTIGFTACPSTAFNLYTFKILNKERKRFIIQKK